MVWRRTESEDDLEEYMRMKGAIKRIVREAKRRVNGEWSVGIVGNFKENKRKIWRG